MKKLNMFLVIWCTFLINTLYGQWEEINYPVTGGSIPSIVISGTDLFTLKGYTFKTVYQSKDNASTWNLINIGIEGVAVYELAVNGKTCLANTGEGLFISTNDGAEWNMAGFEENTIHAIAVCGSNIFASIDSNGVYVSKDDGVSWNEVNNGLSNKHVNVLFVNNNTIFAGTRGGVFLSNDNGDLWTSAGLMDKSIYEIAVKGANIIAAVSTKGICFSKDMGVSWTEINEGLSSTQVMGVAISSTHLFVGVKNGLFATAYDGTLWKDTELPRLITTLAASDTYLFASTRKGGGGPDVAAKLHRLPLSSVHITPQSKTLMGHNQLKMRINNADNTLKIYYRVESPCFVQLDLYMLSGAHAVSCVRGQHSAGKHCFVIDKNSLPTGLYTCRFKAGPYKENTRLLVVK